MPKINYYPNLPLLPKRIFGTNMIGLTYDDYIVICGITVDPMMECFNLFMNDGFKPVWKQASFTMLTKRFYAASVEFNKQINESSWLITGGEKHDSVGGTVKKLDSTELFQNSSFVSGPVLPHAVSMHCILKLNYTHAIMTGGRGTSSRALKNIHLFSMDFVWGKLANMLVGRYGHACGHYEMAEIIVAGGLNIKETEIYSFKFSEW